MFSSTLFLIKDILNRQGPPPPSAPLAVHTYSSEKEAQSNMAHLEAQNSPLPPNPPTYEDNSWSSILKFQIFRNPDTKFWHDNLTPYFSKFVYFKFHTKTKFCLHLFSCQFIVKNAIFARKIWYRTWISYNTKFGHKIKGSDQRWPDELQKYRTWKIKYRFLEIREFVYRSSALIKWNLFRLFPSNKKRTKTAADQKRWAKSKSIFVQKKIDFTRELSLYCAIRVGFLSSSCIMSWTILPIFLPELLWYSPMYLLVRYLTVSAVLPTCLPPRITNLTAETGFGLGTRSEADRSRASLERPKVRNHRDRSSTSRLDLWWVFSLNLWPFCALLSENERSLKDFSNLVWWYLQFEMEWISAWAAELATCNQKFVKT